MSLIKAGRPQARIFPGKFMQVLDEPSSGDMPNCTILFGSWKVTGFGWWWMLALPAWSVLNFEGCRCFRLCELAI
jgi:hypothetical protein